MEGEDTFEEWEDAFLDQLIQVEELALSAIAKPTSDSHHLPPHPTSSSTSQFPPQPPQRRQNYQQQQPLHSVAASTYDAISYSPPRELSQRSKDFDSFRHSPSGPAKCTSSTVAPTFRRPDKDKDQEIERLKKELGHASKQLAFLEKECLELKKERDKKDEELKSVAFQNEENGRANHLKRIKTECRNLALEHHGVSRKIQDGDSSKDPAAEITYKATGVQTDIGALQEAQDILKDDMAASLDLSQKLLAIWGSETCRKLGSNVISKLLVVCQRDFHFLFGLMCINLPSKITMEFLTARSTSGVALQYIKDCFHTPEAAKVSQLYLMLTKVIEGIAHVESLFEPLLDLCSVENVIIVHSSLSVLHTYLKLLLGLEKDYRRSALYSGTIYPLKEFAWGTILLILVD